MTPVVPHIADGDVINLDKTPPPPPPSPPAASPAVRRRILWVVVALTIAAAVFAGWAGLRWWQASNDESLELAQTRDQVLIAAHNNIETLNSLDYRDVDDGLDAWLDATTGDLHDQLAEVGDQDKQAIQDAAKVSTGRVVEAAVIDLSAGGDSASVIAVVEVTVQPVDGETTVKSNRFTGDLVLDDGEWKLASLEQVPVVAP